MSNKMYRKGKVRLGMPRDIVYIGDFCSYIRRTNNHNASKNTYIDMSPFLKDPIGYGKSLRSILALDKAALGTIEI